MITTISKEAQELGAFLRGIETCLHLQDCAGVAEWLDIRCKDIVNNVKPLRERSDSYVYRYTKDLEGSNFDYLTVIIYFYAVDPGQLKNRIHVKVRNFNGDFKSLIIHKNTYLTAMYMQALGLAIENNKLKKL